MTFIDSFPLHLQSWKGEQYHMWVFDELLPDYPDNHALSAASSSPLNDENVMIDVLRLEDVKDIQAAQTVQYETKYLEALITQEPYRHMNACIRVKCDTTEGWKLASWCVTHYDLTIGLLATKADFRRRGYAQLCLGSVIAKQQKKAKISKCLAFIHQDNRASAGLFRRFGFCRVDAEPFFWAGLEIDSR
jgi:ribosomal protein S18 acetylase RimI-like enzyme